MLYIKSVHNIQWQPAKSRNPKPELIQLEADGAVASVTFLASGRVAKWLRLPGWQRQPLMRVDWLGAALILAVSVVFRLGWMHFMRGDSSVAELLIRWDGQHFLDIAKYGYLTATGEGLPEADIYHTRLAFFPGLPMLMRAIHSISGMEYMWAGVLIASIASYFMLVAIMALAGLMGAQLPARLAAAVMLAGAPLNITFMMVYTEAPFLALALWALVAVIYQRWLYAAILISIAGLFRLTTIDLVLAFAVVVAIYATKNLRAWAAVIFSMLPMVGYLWWASSYTRDIGGYFGLQKKGWHSSFDFGVATVRWISRRLQGSQEIAYIFSIIVIVVAVAMVFFAFRRLPWAYWLFSAAVVANVVLSDGIMTSRPRLLLPAVLLFLPWVIELGDWIGRRKWLTIAIGYGLAGSWFSIHMITVFPYAI
ncbi:hypothetical protein ACFLIN_05415 [Corynebacterium kutscheri]|uniref:hypothetical protein n=1 Tax=Corynebacterium kutscheri TaxID=35755 RepID=UPI0037BFDE68